MGRHSQSCRVARASSWCSPRHPARAGGEQQAAAALTQRADATPRPSPSACRGARRTAAGPVAPADLSRGRMLMGSRGGGQQQPPWWQEQGRGASSWVPSPRWVRWGGLQHRLPLPQQQHPSAGSKALLRLPCRAGLAAGRAAPAVVEVPRRPETSLCDFAELRGRVEAPPCSASRACGSGEGAARARGFPPYGSRELAHARTGAAADTVTKRAGSEKETGGASKLSGQHVPDTQLPSVFSNNGRNKLANLKERI